jgi:hypothetical protein
MPRHNALMIYWDFSPEFVPSLVGLGALSSVTPPLGVGEPFFSIGEASTLGGMFLMLGLFWGFRKLWA